MISKFRPIYLFLLGYLICISQNVIFGSYLPTDSDSKEIDIVSADDYGNYYLHVLVSVNRVESMIADLEWDVIIMHVNASNYGEDANKEIIRVLAPAFEVKENQLIVVAGKEDKLKKIMLIDFPGNEFQVVNRICYKCEYLLNPKRENRRKKERRKRIHDQDLSLKEK
ncbi:uncharacterized protein LOC142321085 [Lycorma delicatula]|uniref:uncharacterized protein LOC142321085 n=1 Tax=Lycorma delicatula TaxID=130591 RepID=UPI003F51A8D5